MIERNLFTAGVSRRDFMKALTVGGAAVGLSYASVEKVAEAADSPDKRPPVIWLHFQECTGCSEALVRATHPGIGEVLLDIINVEYQETLMAAAGHLAHENLQNAIKKFAGKYILVIEGSIPKLDGGVCCQIGGETAIESFKVAAENAACIVNLGSCSTCGGIAAADPNPTQASGTIPYMPEGKPYISLPGCPPNPYNILSVIMYYITFGTLPEVMADEKYFAEITDAEKRKAVALEHRPAFAYGRLIHEHCERRPHFDAGRFVTSFGSEEHKKGWCLYKMGCKGPETYANCSVIHFNDGAAWPIGNGCPCIGCTEGSVLFKKSLHQLADVAQPTPNANVPTSKPEGLGVGATPTQTAFVGAAVGLAVGAGAMYAAKLPKESEDENK